MLPWLLGVTAMAASAKRKEMRVAVGPAESSPAAAGSVSTGRVLACCCQYCNAATKSPAMQQARLLRDGYAVHKCQDNHANSARAPSNEWLSVRHQSSDVLPARPCKQPCAAACVASAVMQLQDTTGITAHAAYAAALSCLQQRGEHENMEDTMQLQFSLAYAILV